MLKPIILLASSAWFWTAASEGGQQASTALEPCSLAAIGAGIEARWAMNCTLNEGGRSCPGGGWVPELVTDGCALTQDANSKRLAMAKAGARVFLVGDSVIGQLCVLGREDGLCCSDLRLCEGRVPPTWKLSHTGRKVDKGWDIKFTDGKDGWQHYGKYLLKINGRAAPDHSVYQLAVQVSEDAGVNEQGLGLLQEVFWGERNHSWDPHDTPYKPTQHDVLIVNPGLHLHTPAALRAYMLELHRRVVSRFPGPVLWMDATPQHFSSGTWQREWKPSSGERRLCHSATSERTRRTALWRTEVWRSVLDGVPRRSNVAAVEVGPLLLPLFFAHRAPGDCTHWVDSVYSGLSQIIWHTLIQLQAAARVAER